MDKKKNWPAPVKKPALARGEIRELMARFLEGGENETYVWERITTAEGLPHEWIYDLFQDSAGRIWAGTWGGGAALFRDGAWTAFDRRHGLASDAVTAFAEDADGRVWAATDRGLSVFDGGRFLDAGLTGKSLLSIRFDRRGRLWAGCWRMAHTGGGLYCLEGGRWTAFTVQDGLPGMEILKVFEDSRGHIWAGTYEHGLGAGVGRFDGSAWTRYSTKDGLIDNCVYSMFEDPEGKIWFGTTGGIGIFDPAAGTWHRMTQADGLADDRVYCMLIDSRKKMWFGTENGVSRFDGAQWTTFTRTAGLAENLVRAVLEDRGGRLWFGAYPYAAGRGGIAIASRAVGGRSLPADWQKYLPREPRRLKS